MPVVAIFVLASCTPGGGEKIQGGGLITGTPTNTAASEASLSNRIVCDDGRLLVGDLQLMDDQVKDGLKEAKAEATIWQSDAKLTRLRVGCQLFEPKFRWQATFYSESAQTFYSSDTSETEPAEVAPSEVFELPTADLSFGMVRRSLLKAGLADGDVISPSSGVDIRYNSQALPFGPSSAPKETVIYHVSIERQGETKDIFVSGKDGSIYQYANNGQ